jgi:hypothetical protein
MMRSIIAFLAAFATPAAAQGYALCPDLTEVGKGSTEYEEARRCVRVMAARFSASGESPADVATAAIEFCRDWKIAPLVAEQGNILTQKKLQNELEKGLRDKAILVVVQMRAGNCANQPGLFDGVIEPIE